MVKRRDEKVEEYGIGAKIMLETYKQVVELDARNNNRELDENDRLEIAIVKSMNNGASLLLLTRLAALIESCSPFINDDEMNEDAYMAMCSVAFFVGLELMMNGYSEATIKKTILAEFDRMIGIYEENDRDGKPLTSYTHLRT